MKKLFLLLVIASLFMQFIVGCSLNSGKKSEDHLSPEIEIGIIDETAMSGVSTWMNSSYEKVLTDDKSESNNTYRLYMGKNEKEGVQVSLRSEKYKEFTFELISSLPDGISCQINRVYKTVLIDGERYADPVAPIDGSLILVANSTQSLYIEFKTESSAEAGEYKAVFALKENGKIICTYGVDLVVWNFAYPDTPTYKTTVGLSKNSIAFELGYIKGYYDQIPEQYEEEVMSLYLTYYEYLLDNKISPTELPYDILDPRADAYMSDPRLTSFSVPAKTGSHGKEEYISDETLKKYYKKLISNPDWIEKAYIYPVDEPSNKASLDEITEQLKRYKQIAPKLRVATSFFMNFSYDENKDAVDVLTENLTMLSIKTCTFNAEDKKYGIQDRNGQSLSDRMKEYVKNGGEMWTYICWEPGEPYANMYVNEPGINHRISFWQQYDVGSCGFLYWSSNYWECVRNNPWTNMATVPWVSPNLISPVHGDGSLLYPGRRIGINGPCGSLRLFAVRDGVEDVMLLQMAEKLFGREYVDEMIDSITTSMTEYTQDSALFEAVRVKIGNAVSGEIENK